MATRAQQLAAQQKAAAAAKAAADKAAAAKAAQQAAAAKAAADKAQYAVSERQMNTDARGILKAAKAQAAAAANPPVATRPTPGQPEYAGTTGGPKPAPVKPQLDPASTGGPKPAPSLNPKPQIDQGYGNGIGYDGKPLYSDIRAGLNAAVGKTPTPVAAPLGRPTANPTGPMVPTLGGGTAPASVAKTMKKGGRVKAKAKSSYSSGGSVGSASKRGDGIAQRGKTKGRMV